MRRLGTDLSAGQVLGFAGRSTVQHAGSNAKECRMARQNFIDERWQSARAAPADAELLSGRDVYDEHRPLYRCSACMAEGSNSMHKYIDECPHYVEPRRAPAN